MTIEDREMAALEVLRSTGIDVLEAALVAKEALECGRVGGGGNEEAGKDGDVCQGRGNGLGGQEAEGSMGAVDCGFPVSLQADDENESRAGGAASEE